jgi:ABC-2 type transport system permease protein
MNLFKYELRVHLRSIILWTVGIFVMIAGGMGKYAGFSASGQPASELFNKLPKPVLAIFGVSALDIDKASGFYGVLFMYLILMAGIHAAMLGSEILIKEERDHTAEFLMVKPITRSAVITAKLSAGVVNLIIFNLMTLIISITILSFVSKGEVLDAEVFLLMFGMFLLQLIFFSLGLCFSAISRFSRVSGVMTSVILFSTYLLSFIIDVYEKVDFLKFLTPFKYFDAKTLISEGRIEPIYLLLSTLIICFSIFITYNQYAKRDLWM